MTSAETPHPQQRGRLIRRKGDTTTQVKRSGLDDRLFNDLYPKLLAAPWWVIIVVFTACFFALNTLYAVVFYVLAATNTGNDIVNAAPGHFSDYFFFSVQTLATIGYGGMVPKGLLTNIFVAIEALSGLGLFAVLTGLIYSRFSRPTARVTFSEMAVINNSQGPRQLIFRLTNDRGNRIVDVETSLVLLRDETMPDGKVFRRFYDLSLRRARAPLVQLSWSLMHIIDDQSPLFGLDADDLKALSAEIIVSLKGIDETLSQTIHTQFSYCPEDIAFDAEFVDLIEREDNGTFHVHFERVHDIIR